MNDGTALRAKVKQLGPAKIAERSGVPISTLMTWMKATESDMRARNLAKIVAAVKALEAEAPEPITHAGEIYYPVPVYDVRAKAGAGALVEDGEPIHHQMYRQDWLKSIAPGSLASLSLIEVSGDSMEPTLRPRDQILVDRAVKRVTKDGIYILLFEGQLLVKRCWRDLTDGSIAVKSDNPEYPMQRIKKHDQLEVIGMVVWFARVIG